jgi:phospholipid/cholesterol/gamma-HCH transport system substrate-binding protein
MRGVRLVVLKFGVFVAVSLLLLWTLLNTMLHGVDAPTTTYHALFTDVSGLRVGDDVKIAGVRVGRVQGISVHGDDAEVDLQVQSSQPVLSNSRLTMRYQNLVGQRYVAIDQPATRGTQLTPGATIPAGQTSPGFDLTELLNGFRPLFEVLKPDDVNTLATSIVEVLQGEGGTVDSLLQQTASLTTFVASRDQVIGEVLTRLTPVLQDFAAHDSQLKSSIVSLEQLMTGLARDRTSIGGSIDAISKLIDSTTGLVDAVRKPLVGTVTQLRASAGMVAANRDTLSGALAGFQQAIGALGRGTSYENALNIYLCSLAVGVGDSGPTINPAGSNPPRSAVCQ